MVLKMSTALKIAKSEIKYNYIKNMKKNDYRSFLEKEYFRRTGDILNLTEPKKYTEKMQYAKLYDNTPEKTKLSDKYLVREWIAEKIGSEYLIPILGVWDKYTDINFTTLPEKFVLKTNHGSAMHLIVNDKRKINHFKEKIKFSRWLNKNFAYDGDLQLHYKDIKPKIIAEQFIQDSNNKLTEYKFFCFHGQVYYCWFRLDTEIHGYGNIYDLDWNLQPWVFKGRPNTPYEISEPGTFEKMLKIATKLAEDFSHVRVDLYDVDGKIYFGEMTFTSTGGYRLIEPEEYNYHLGDLWNLKDTEHKI